MERPNAIALDLDEAEVEIQQRWFVWTAAGLTVHPVTWTDQNDAARPGPRVGRSEVTTPRSLGLHVSRPIAHADIILQSDGCTEVAVLRPETDALVRETAHVGSVAAFGELLDRVVDLITWSGVPKDDGGAAASVTPEPGDGWILGYDGERWPSEA